MGSDSYPIHLQLKVGNIIAKGMQLIFDSVVAIPHQSRDVEIVCALAASPDLDVPLNEVLAQRVEGGAE